MLAKYRFYFLFFIIIGVLNSCVTTTKSNEYSHYENSIDLKFSVFENVPGAPYIDIAIENNKYLAFFDTGTSDVALMMSKEDIEQIDLEVVGEQHFASIKETYTVSEYLLPEFTMDDKFIIKNAKVSERPPEFGTTTIMGLPAFNGYNILISYKQKKLFLYNKSSDLEFINNWTKVDIIKMDKGNGPFFNGKVAGINRPFVFYLDTGGSYYDYRTDTTSDLILNRDIRNKGVEKKYLEYEFSGRKFRINKFAYLGEINKNAPIDAFIGYYFLQRYDVFLDLENKIFYIEN